MRVVVLASGSGGNATLFEWEGRSLLVDAGLGPRTLAGLLRSASAKVPDAIVVTHAHGDHAGRADELGRRFGAEVFLSEATSRAVPLSAGVRARTFGARAPFEAAGFVVSPLPLPHDAAQVALVVSGGAHRAGLATDLGEVPPGLEAHLEGCDVVLLESNHDEAMLARGPYPAYLKRRIASSGGHLSNGQARELVARLAASPRPPHTIGLMHLSKTNNAPRLALETSEDAVRGRPTRLFVAPPRGPVALECGRPGRVGTPGQLGLPFA